MGIITNSMVYFLKGLDCLSEVIRWPCVQTWDLDQLGDFVFMVELIFCNIIEATCLLEYELPCKNVLMISARFKQADVELACKDLLLHFQWYGYSVFMNP